VAEPIDLEELADVVGSGSYTSREIARQLGRRHADVRRALRDWRFVSVRDGRRHVWGLTIDGQPEAEAPPDESEEVPGTVPDQSEEQPEEPTEEQPEEEPEFVEATVDLDGVIAIALDEHGEEVLARIRVLPGGSLIADQFDDQGKLLRIFEPEGIIDIVAA